MGFYLEIGGLILITMVCLFIGLCQCITQKRINKRVDDMAKVITALTSNLNATELNNALINTKSDVAKISVDVALLVQVTNNTKS